MANATTTLNVRLEPPKFYVYKCTTQQLEDALNHISESGDQVVQPAFLGGRDWIIVCIKAANKNVGPDVRDFIEAGGQRNA